MMARTAARHTNLQDVAHDFARRAFLRIADEREDAESKAETYVGICRALYSFDKTEAAEYFNRSVEVVSKFGDEVIDRWQAAIDLATAAADPHHEKPELAYNFARCAEVIYDYMARDKYFDWEGTVKAIAELCPSSFFAIASRWRDRRFGDAAEILPEGCLHLLRSKRLDPRLCTALVGFRARWEWGELLGLALTECSCDEARIQIRDLILRYMRLDGQSASTWSSVISILDQYQLQVTELAEVHAYQLQAESGHRSSSNYSPVCKETADSKDWEKIFEGLDLATVDGISTSFQRFKACEPPFYTTKYAKELYSRIPSNKASECVSAIADVPQFELYQYSELLEAIPEEWRSRFAVQTSLVNLGKRIAHRHGLELIRSRFYRRFSIDRASALLGVTERQFSGWVIEAIGRQQENLGAERLFSLVGLLTGWLSRGEAEDALLFGLGLFEPSLDGEAGDGPWSERLRPPSDINAAAAGYIWSQLAAPSASLRWEAAHVVTALARLGSHAPVGSLIKFAEHGSGLCFADSQLHFYGWHARLWLMIALAKMAHERPMAAAPHADFLMDWAVRQQPHVQIRHFAADALRELASEGNLVISATDADALAWVNRSKLPVEQSKRYSERRSARRTQREPVAERGFVFGYDTTEYWFSRLAEVFARTAGEVEVAAESVILKDWKLDENGHWDKDARSKRGIIRSSHHHKDELSAVDDLNDYLSFHAMMVVAGKWLDTYPVHQDPEDADDEFSNWLARYSLCRSDGGWLADRRDEPPSEFAPWKNEQLDEAWRWSVSQADFDRALISREGHLNLWGHWENISGSYEETINISSALVGRSQSGALVRALQTCHDPMDYAIPSFEDDRQLESGAYSLRGWVDRGFGRDGLDKADPWAAKIPYPTYKPAPFVCELLKLSPDREGRIWSSSAADCHGHVNVHVWGTYSDPSRSNDHGGEGGQRLQMFPQLLEYLLKLSEADLIVKIKIERRKRYSRYEGNSEHERGYIPPYCKIFCFNSARQIVSLR